MIVRYRNTSEVPQMTRGTEHSAGFDIALSEPKYIPAQTRVPTKASTGLYVEIPAGYVGLLCSRSGRTAEGLVVATPPGVIDPDYRGEVFVLLHNRNDNHLYLEAGERVAQLVIVRQAAILGAEKVEELSETVRGSRGLGSTGKLQPTHTPEVERLRESGVISLSVGADTPVTTEALNDLPAQAGTPPGVEVAHFRGVPTEDEVQVADEVAATKSFFNETPPPPLDPLAVACPDCGAAIGQPCDRGAYGVYIAERAAHAGRVSRVDRTTEEPAPGPSETELALRRQITALIEDNERLRRILESHGVRPAATPYEPEDG